MADKPLCSIPDCGKPSRHVGFCRPHYLKQRELRLPPCSAIGCANRSTKRGLCHAHYAQDLVRQKPICSVAGCLNHARTHGLCMSHYKRSLKYGDPLSGSTNWGAARDFMEATILIEDRENCVKWPFAHNSQGAAQIRISQKTQLVSRIVCERHSGPPPTEQHQAAHNCGKGHEGCINPWHLRWATQQENEADKLVHGTRHHGEENWFAKLTTENVIQIRRELGEGRSQAAIGKRYGVSTGCIHAIHSRRTWAWLED